MPIDQAKLADEVRRVTEAIARVMAVDDDLEDADAEKLHELLIGCVAAVNTRLRHCDELLRKGLRQEAIQECEREPNVLDLAAALEMPEWDAWADYAKQFGLAPQPRLLTDVAADLNAAYVQAQSLGDVMRLYRLHNLARSPLAVRLPVLRTIAARDPENDVWQNDVRAFEGARCRELGLELAKANSTNDFRTIAALHREIGAADWQTPPPAPLRDKVDESHRRLVVQHARQALTGLTQQVDAAFAQFDVAAGRLAREAWEQQAEIAELGPDDDFVQHVRPAFDWLDQVRDDELRQEGLARAVAKLEAAIDDDRVGAVELRRLYGAAERFDEAIPSRLVRRYEERLRALELTASRRTRMVAMLAGLAVLLTGAATFLVVNWQLKSREVQRVRIAMTEHLGKKEFRQARDFYDAAAKDAAYVAAAPEIKSLLARLESEEGSDRQRQQRFAASINQARSLAEKGGWASIDDADRELAAAKADARTEEEKLQLAEVARLVGANKAELQESVDDKYFAEVDAIKERMTNLAALGEVQLQDLLNVAWDVRGRARVSSDAIKQSSIDLYVQKVKDRQQTVRQLQGEREAMAELGETIGMESSFAQAFKVYERLQPSPPSGEEVEELLKQSLSRLATVEAWNQTAGQWNKAAAGAGDARPTALEVIAVLAKDFAGFPGVADVLTRKAYLESVAVRHGSTGDDPPLDQIRQILNHKWFDMQSMQLEDKVLYFKDSPNVATELVSVRHLIDRNSPEVKLTPIRKSEIKPRADGQLFGPSAHSQFRDAAGKWLENGGDKSYEELVCGVLAILQKQSGMDPLLQCYLLQTFVETALPGSTILTDNLKEFRAALKTDVELSERNWVSYDDAEIRDLRKNIESLLKRVNPRITPVVLFPTKIAPQLQQMLNFPRLPELRWVGVMLPGEGSGWNCATRPSLTRGLAGPLVVFDASRPASDPLVTIGRADNGKCVVESTASISDGQLVFLVLPIAK